MGGGGDLRNNKGLRDAAEALGGRWGDERVKERKRRVFYCTKQMERGDRPEAPAEELHHGKCESRAMAALPLIHVCAG